MSPLCTASVCRECVSTERRVSTEVGVSIKPRWQTQAACRFFPSDLFFSVGSSDVARADQEEAKTVCRMCPVQAECLEYALSINQEFGVWGGMSEDERRALKADTTVAPRA